MAFIGNTVQTQGFSPAIDYFNGNGVTVTFTLSRPVASVAQMIVAVDNVIQNPSSAFTVAGNAITFTSAPLSGTNNIWVEYTSLITTYNAISQDPSVIGDITATGGYLAEGDFGNSYIDGTIVDYVTGNARITTGPADGLTIYNGGTTARTSMASWSSTGLLTLTNAGGNTVFPVAAGTVMVSGNMPAFSAYKSGSTYTGFSLNTYTKVQLDAEAFDTANCFDTTNYRFTPNVAGYYAIQLSIEGNYQTSMYSFYGAYLYKNGVEYARNSVNYNATVYGGLPLSILVYMNGTTDYLELYVRAVGGSNPLYDQGQGVTFMSGYLARSA